MLTFPLLTAAICISFIYRAMHPDLHTFPKVAKRVRVGLAAVAMVLCTSAAYRFPIEVGEVIRGSQTRLSDLQVRMKEQQVMAERHHVTSMIDSLGGIDNYRLYLETLKTTNKQK